MNHRNKFDESDWILTTEDPYDQLKDAPPGVYRIIDCERGVVEDVAVASDGSVERAHAS